MAGEKLLKGSARPQTAIIGFDGLGPEDFDALLPFMPALAERCRNVQPCRLAGAPLSGAQAAWAEILTGEEWYRNGCCGYARPAGSLNKLAVMSEAELAVSPYLVASSGERISIIANVPLLRPDPSSRIWLSDGSLPINRTVSPPALLKQAPFDRYRARASANAASAQAALRKTALDWVDVERTRIKCLSALVDESEFEHLIFRLSVFDQLSHRFGTGFLRAKDLFSSAATAQMLSELDDLIEVIAARPDMRLLLLSTFAHVPCTGTINLNSVLEESGYLKVAGAAAGARQASGRMEAAARLFRGEPQGFLLRTYEGTLDLAQTQAASPIAGCIFINRKSVFGDGAVNEGDCQRIAERLLVLLKRKLEPLYGSRLHILARPAQLVTPVPTPDLIVHIDGVEFHDKQGRTNPEDRPRTTHGNHGFLVDLSAPSTTTTTGAAPSASLTDNEVKRTEIAEMLRSR